MSFIAQTEQIALTAIRTDRRIIRIKSANEDFDSFEYAMDLINRKEIIDQRTFMSNALNIGLAEELQQPKFIEAMNDYRSFEGINNIYCINLTGAWLKYALDGKYNKDKMKPKAIIEDILGSKFSELTLPITENLLQEMGGGTTPHHSTTQSLYHISNEMYCSINWFHRCNILIEDLSKNFKYMIVKCKKQRSNNSWHELNMIIVRPKDLIEVVSTSRSVSEYRRYFTKLAEIDRSFNDTYQPWLNKYYRSENLTLNQKIDQQSVELQQLIAITKDNNAQNKELIAITKENNTQIKELNKKVEILNTRFVMFVRVIIPTWLGSKVLEQQYCTFDALKGQLYAKKHLKVMFFVGFFIANDDTVETTKIVNDKEIKLRIRGTMKIFSCCTNFGNVGARIKKLYERFTIIKGDPKNPKNPQKIIMFMLKPHAITLISTEINSERIVSENCTYANHVSEDGIILNPRVFPSDTIASWNSKFKCYDLQVCTRIFDKATAIFETICNNTTHERYQGYQQRIDGYDRESDEHLTPQLVEYINSQDQVFYDETRPYSQIFINDYVYEVVDEDHDTVEWSYKISEKTKCARSDVDNHKFTNCHYALNRILHLIRNLGSKDYVQDMIDSNLISDRDIPAMKAIAAKTKDLEVPRFEELEEEA